MTVAVAGATAAADTPAVVGPPLATAVVDPMIHQDPHAKRRFSLIRQVGATFVRLTVQWEEIAPNGASKPAVFDAGDSADPAYKWKRVDREIQSAISAGLEPIVNIVGAPRWAQRGKQAAGYGPNRPSALELGLFARAIATRYEGRDPTLPRVRYWQIWNEPNITPFLMPQFVRGTDASPGIYRSLVNSFASAIHAVSPANRVVAGALSPFTVNYRAVKSIGPLKFMRELLCLSAGANPRPTCRTAVHFDIWAHNPYTTGGPTHQATNPNDVSLGDLPEMRALLGAAQRARQIVAPHGLGFWVTEFSWDTNPPDPHGVPLALQGRWTSEALYQMWQSGVTLATWFTLQDAPYPRSPFQAGLLFGRAPLAQARRKPAFTAFRFPFVAYRRSSGVYVWGRTPAGRSATLLLERRSGTDGVWRRVSTLQTDRHGIVSGLLPLAVAPTDFIRARALGSISLAFSLTEPPDRAYRPFG